MKREQVPSHWTDPPQRRHASSSRPPVSLEQVPPVLDSEEASEVELVVPDASVDEDSKVSEPFAEDDDPSLVDSNVVDDDSEVAVTDRGSCVVVSALDPSSNVVPSSVVDGVCPLEPRLSVVISTPDGVSRVSELSWVSPRDVVPERTLGGFSGHAARRHAMAASPRVSIEREAVTSQGYQELLAGCARLLVTGLVWVRAPASDRGRRKRSCLASSPETNPRELRWSNTV